jgi:hypothetical protein
MDESFMPVRGMSYYVSTRVTDNPDSVDTDWEDFAYVGVAQLLASWIVNPPSKDTECVDVNEYGAVVAHLVNHTKNNQIQFVMRVEVRKSDTCERSSIGEVRINPGNGGACYDWCNEQLQKECVILSIIKSSKTRALYTHI